MALKSTKATPPKPTSPLLSGWAPAKFTGRLSVCTKRPGKRPPRRAGLERLNRLAQSLKKFRNIFPENNYLMPLKIRVPMFFAFHDIQKNIAAPVFLDIKKVCPPFRF
jgi:hypothetical protein